MSFFFFFNAVWTPTHEDELLLEKVQVPWLVNLSSFSTTWVSGPTDLQKHTHHVSLAELRFLSRCEFFSSCCCQRGRLCLEAAGASFVGRQPSFCTFCPMSGETPPRCICWLELSSGVCHFSRKKTLPQCVVEKPGLLALTLHFKHHPFVTQLETGFGAWCFEGSSFRMMGRFHFSSTSEPQQRQYSL